MRFLIRHSTVYEYESPILLQPHLLRLQPRSDATQRLDRFSLHIDPQPYGRAEWLDQDGNSVTQIWFQQPANRLVVTSEVEAVSLRTNPYDFLLPVQTITAPQTYSDVLSVSMQPYLRGEHHPDVAAFAEGIASRASHLAMNFLDLLSAAIFQGWEQETRLRGEPHPAHVTLAARRGSCRDLAVLFCECCRSVGLAARFVSGYEQASAIHDHPHMHSWSEVYLPGGGWRAYDPARGTAVSSGHIAVAAAALPFMAAPITGTFRGPGSSTMRVSLKMRVEPNGASQFQTQSQTL